MSARYRFGFVLSTGAGNATRLLNLRRYAERDPDIECTWATDGGGRGRLERLRAAATALRAVAGLDAVMFHAFEAYVFAALRSLLAPRPLLVWSRDDPPTRDPGFWSAYGVIGRSALRTDLRFALDAGCASRVALFVPFTRYGASALAGNCGLPAQRIHAIHVGVDLALWRPLARRGAARLPSLLFVGGDFERKGGALLVDLCRRELAGRAELHLVTRSAPRDVPDGVFVHDDLGPNDERLRVLYADADVFVLPTNGDMTPFAVLEAMASGLPVVATDVGGIPDLVEDGETGFLVAPGDRVALAARIGQLVDDVGMRRRMGAAGRARVEREFDARANVPRIIDLMKRSVDAAS